MKVLIWDESLSVQIQEIDDDHRKLVDLFNILGQSVEEESSSDYIEAVLEELISCTDWHFKHEERLMLKYGYQGLVAHKAEHQELINSAKAVQQKFLQQNGMISNEDIAFLEQWLTGHILGADIEMGSYLGEVM